MQQFQNLQELVEILELLEILRLKNVQIVQVVQAWHVSDLAQELALFLSDSGLVPHRQLQGALPELPLVDRRIHESLVPARLHRLLHRFGPPLALVAARRGGEW